MLKSVAFAALAATLAGCAGTPPPGEQPPRLVGDEQGVTVTGLPYQIDAGRAAVNHCSKYGRSSQYIHSLPNDGGYVFKCVQA